MSTKLKLELSMNWKCSSMTSYKPKIANRQPIAMKVSTTLHFLLNVLRAYSDACYSGFVIFRFQYNEHYVYSKQTF